MSQNTGYSGTPLVRKLGLKPGQVLYLSGAPENYFDLTAPLPPSLTVQQRLSAPFDVAHIFCRARSDLQKKIPRCLEKLKPGGAIWVSWPKRASGVHTDITEDTIRETALPLGLVDVKVCAVDETWSGLRLVRRKT